MYTLVKVLLVWIGGATGLPVGADMPSIRFESPPLIHEFVHPLQPAIAHGGTREAVAYYDPSKGEIVLPRGWRPDDPFAVSILVHELVHFMQDRASLKYPCPGAREKEAYAAQAAWLASQGLDLFDNDVMPMDRMFVLVVTTCSP